LNRAILVNMEHFTLHIDNQGRVMLPAWWRRKEGVAPSTKLCVAVTEEGALIVETREQGLRRARALLRKYIPQGVNLSGELIAERRAEAARESEQRP
jgi:bifunctional DNA-binding transcriptional regulator/antitoxin component of YhaV-PrlF toxin-antitoxin module